MDDVCGVWEGRTREQGQDVIVLGLICIGAALYGFGFIAGRNRAKREERARMVLRDRYR